MGLRGAKGITIVATSRLSDKGDRLASLRIDHDKRAADPVRTRSGWSWLFWLLVVAAGAGATAWLKYGESLAPATEVRVAFVEVNTRSLLSANGYIESRQQAAIGAKVPGRIKEIRVEEGQRVAMNEIIAVLEHADLDASLASMKAAMEQVRFELAEADASLEQSDRDLKRAESLDKKGIVARADYEQAQSQRKVAAARVQSRRASLVAAEARASEIEQTRENMFVRAPFAGTVISKDGEVGETITPGGMGEASGRGSVATIADLDHLQIDTDVKEDFISRVVIGQPAEIAVDSVPDLKYQGRVRKVIPMGDRARGTIKVKVEILDNDARLFPEMSATVHFLPAAKEAQAAPAITILVSETAVRSVDKEAFVWVVDSEHLRRTVVEVGAADKSGRMPVVRGLKGGESVVINPSDALTEGQKVRIAK